MTSTPRRRSPLHATRRGALPRGGWLRGLPGGGLPGGGLPRHGATGGRLPRHGATGVAVPVVGLLLAGLLAFSVAIAPSASATEDWVIESFDAQITIHPDGDLTVVETIAVDFRNLPSRGIFRHIPIRERIDEDTIRRFGLTDIAVSTTTEAPDDLDITREFDEVMFRIGDPDVFLTGAHTYELTYRYEGVLNRFEQHDELWWSVTGDEWDVVIEQVSATVTAPADITDVWCYEGPEGSTDFCGSAEFEGQTATFTGGPLVPSWDGNDQLDVVVELPRGAVDVAEPDLEPASGWARTFRATPLTLTGAGLLTLLGLGWLAAIVRRGRDAPAPAGAAGVEYRPPLGLRPAQLRTLRTQRVHKVALSATIVDLAVRGHLRIEEIEDPSSRWRSKDDWRLTRTLNPADGLRPFEKLVLTGLFGSRTLDPYGPQRLDDDTTLAADPAAQRELDEQIERAAALDSADAGQRVAAGVTGATRAIGDEHGVRSVVVSALPERGFAKTASAFNGKLYDDVVAHGFFKRDPSTVRTVAAGLSFVMLLLGFAGLITVLVTYGMWGLITVPLIVFGALGIPFSRFAPRRTARGAEVNARAKGFEEFITTAEADRMAFAEREMIFAAYLPYAMVFGAVDRWSKAFAAIGIAPAAAAGTWYVGRRFGDDFGDFGRRLDTFGSQAGSTMRSTPSGDSSGSGFSGGGGGGFSGGGGGGGGGGRW